MAGLLLAEAPPVVAGAPPPWKQAVGRRMVEAPWVAGLPEEQLNRTVTGRTAPAPPQQVHMGWAGAGGWHREEASKQLATGRAAEVPEPGRIGSMLAVQLAAYYMETPFAAL